MTEEMPSLSINSQYIKDLSFENPKAPSALASLKTPPKIDLSLDLHINKLDDQGLFKVELSIESKATHDSDVLFIIELIYGGVFEIKNMEEETLKTVLAVHCPAMLFPFAREIIASTTQKAGFQPLMIDPIDFGILYHKKIAEENLNNNTVN